MPQEHACPYCGTTQGLRITRRDPGTNAVLDVVCENDFHAMDDGPSFTDLEKLPTQYNWEWIRARLDYEDPFGYSRGRSFRR